MKKITAIIAAGVLIGGAIAYATQDETLSQREVRDPLQLEAVLEANANDAETRIAAIEAVLTIEGGVFDTDTENGTNRLVFVTTGGVTNVIDANIDG